MKIRLSKRALKGYSKLTSQTRKKADKQFIFLDKNFTHPSLKTKKMVDPARYEARIDYHYILAKNWQDKQRS